VRAQNYQRACAYPKLEEVGVRVPLTEAVFEEVPSSDSAERLFRWQDKSFRAVSAEKVGFYRDLIDRGILSRLIDQGFLIQTEVTDLDLDGFGLVLEHHNVPFRSVPIEWCSAMLKDAALMLIRLLDELARVRLTLKRARPWQMLFEGPRSYWVDTGAIIPSRGGLSRTAYADLLQQWVWPLKVMAAGHERAARRLLEDYDCGLLEAEYEALTRKPRLRDVLQYWCRQTASLGRRWTPGALRRVARRILKSVSPQTAPASHHVEVPVAALDELAAEIEALPISGCSTSWSDYTAVHFPDFAAPETWDGKERSWEQIISAVRPRTILDIGSNRGWFAQLAARMGISTVATDIDEPSLNRCYLDVKESNLPVLPVLMDVANPTPGLGVANKWYAPAIERLQADLVSMLALVHHLVFKRHLTFEPILHAVSLFAKRALVIEFIGPQDRFVRDWWSQKYDWYNQENFLRLLQREYRSIEEFPSRREHCMVLLCTR
jgi:hypothetical protein